MILETLEDEPTSEPTTYKPTMSPVRSPTLSPTISNEPSISFPPTNYPTSSPVVPIRVNIVLTLRSVSDGEDVMNRGEVDAFIDLFTSFLNAYTGSSMAVDNVGLWYQQLVLVDDDREGKNDNVLNVTSTNNAQVVQLRKQQRRKKLERTSPPQVNALQLTIIIEISFTTLPLELVENMAVVTIQENEVDLVRRFKVLSMTLPYFADIYGLDVYWIEKLEIPTSSSNMTSDDIVGPMVKSDNEPEEEEKGIGVGGKIFLVFYFLLIFI